MGLNKIHYKKVEQLFSFTRQTWAKWQKENRPIVTLIEKYFNDEDLEEFLNTNEIQKMENLKYVNEFKKFISDIHDSIYLNIRDDYMLYVVDKYLPLIVHKFTEDEECVFSKESVFNNFFIYLEKENLEDIVKNEFGLKVDKMKLYIIDNIHNVSDFEFYMYCENIKLLR